MKHLTTTLFEFVKRMLPLVAVCLLSTVAMAGASSNPVSLQFRLVEDNPTADTEPMTNMGAGPNALGPVNTN